MWFKILQTLHENQFNSLTATRHPFSIRVDVNFCVLTPAQVSRNKAFKTRIPLNEEFQCETITKSFRETIASNTCGAHGKGRGAGKWFTSESFKTVRRNRRVTHSGRKKKTRDCLDSSFFHTQVFLPDRLFCFFSLLSWLLWRCQTNNEAVTNTLNPQQWKQTWLDSMVHYVNNSAHYFVPFPNF